MNQVGTMERPTKARAPWNSPKPKSPPRPAAAPRPVTDRVAQFERNRERAAQGRPLPAALLTLAQRVGQRPWLCTITGAAVGVLAAAAQKLVPWAPFPIIAVLLTIAVAVVSVAMVVRRRVRTGGLLRPQELVIDTDQAIPTAMIMPVGALIGWMAGTLLF